jgi:hypothetical protein
VYEKALIFCSDKRIHDMRRQLIVGNQDATPLADLGNEIAIAAEDTQRDLQRYVANRFSGRQAGLHKVIGANDTRGHANAAYGTHTQQHDRGANQLMSPNVTWFGSFFR